MPSACVKLEKKPSVDTEEAIKQCLSVVEKKVRNLEKRKGKLDNYREQYDKGVDALNEDQKDAISKYDSVIRNLEFARELQKQFQEINDKAEKLLKKREKYDKQLKHNEEVVRMQEVLQVQNILDSMGVDNVRNDFKSGQRGAMVLSEESLNQLDELYKLISPTRDGEISYTEQLTAASEHIVNYLDGKDKEVAGTTYKQLKDLISKINHCGYFDKSHGEEEEEQAEETAEQEPVPEVTSETEESQQPQHEDVVPHTESVVVAAPVTTPQTQITYEESHQIDRAPEQLPQSLPTAMQGSPPTASYPEDEQDSFFSTVQMGRARGFQEIVSSVQGSFNFLQESEIEKQKQQKEVSHVDPAVVVAHPMGVHQTDPLTQSFGSTGGFTLDDQTAYTTQQNTSVSVTSEQNQSQFEGVSPPTAPQSQSTQFGQATTFETSQTETAWSKPETARWSTNTDSIDRNWADQSTGQSQKWGESTNTPTTQNQSWAEQATTPSQSWGDQGSSQSWSAAAGQGPQLNNQAEPKNSSLNPNANIFSSMYQNQNQSSGFSQDSRSSNFDSSSQMNSKKDDNYSQSDVPGGYQTQGYRGRRDYDNNRGFRGNRGGQRGSGNSNGYSRGGNRGYRGNDDRRGGGYSDRGSRGGNRGAFTSSSNSSSFQGYPPRSNYQPEGGYQGMTNGYGYESGLGSFGGKRGGTRGGGMRGGSRGGGNRGGRGGSGGNYSRPTSAQHQQ